MQQREFAANYFNYFGCQGVNPLVLNSADLGSNLRSYRLARSGAYKKRKKPQSPPPHSPSPQEVLEPWKAARNRAQCRGFPDCQFHAVGPGRHSRHFSNKALEKSWDVNRRRRYGGAASTATQSPAPCGLCLCVLQVDQRVR